MIKGRAESDFQLALIELEYAMAAWIIDYSSLRPADKSHEAKRWRSKLSAANHAVEIARLLLGDCLTRHRDAGARLN